MSDNEKLHAALEDSNEKLSIIRAAREDRSARLGLPVTDSKITTSAKYRCAAYSPQDQLNAFRAAELALLERQAKNIRMTIARMEMRFDQRDIETAFEADKLF